MMEVGREEERAGGEDERERYNSPVLYPLI